MASNYATSVYGGIDQQKAEVGGGNLIHMNNVNGGITGGSVQGPIRGGRRRKGGVSGVVPLGLVLANQYTYNRLRGKKGYKSAKRGRGFRSFSRYARGGSHLSPASIHGGTDAHVPVPIKGGNDLPKVMGGNVLPKVMGGNDLPKPTSGGSTLVDLAVPAGFVYVNDRYYNSKKRGFTKRRGTSNRRRRRSNRRRR